MAISIFVVGLLVASTLMTQQVSGHFTLDGSREQQSIGGSEQFYPISGADPSSTRPVKDCLKLPRKNAKNLSPGTFRLPFIIDNTAAHAGPCTAVLIDLDTNASVNIGEQNNCVSSQRAIDVNIPNKACKNCVIKVNVTSTENTPTERYDSCLDVVINGPGGDAGPSNNGGGGGGSAPAQPGIVAPGKGDSSKGDDKKVAVGKPVGPVKTPNRSLEPPKDPNQKNGPTTRNRTDVAGGKADGSSEPSNTETTTKKTERRTSVTVGGVLLDPNRNAQRPEEDSQSRSGRPRRSVRDQTQRDPSLGDIGGESGAGADESRTSNRSSNQGAERGGQPGGACQPGKMDCGSNGEFRICVNGQPIDLPVAKGVQCSKDQSGTVRVTMELAQSP